MTKSRQNKTKNFVSLGIFLTACIASENIESVRGFSSNSANARKTSSVPRDNDAARSNFEFVNTALFNSDNDDVNESQNTEESILTSKSASAPLFASDDEEHSDIPKFGDVVSLKKPTETNGDSSAFFATPEDISEAASATSSDKEQLAERRKRNITVAIASVALAILNYAWQWTHPVTPIQLLVNMEKQSTPIMEIGRNNKPTVMDFWAPWCENCKYMAPTLYQVEEQYRDKVNFVMVNGDDPNNWGLIEKLGVDAIPHMAMIEADGTVDTALIGPVPKQWLTANLDTMIENAENKGESKLTQVCQEERVQKADGTIVSSSVVCAEKDVSKKPLPYNMLDVFANRPNERRIEGAKLAKEDSR